MELTTDAFSLKVKQLMMIISSLDLCCNFFLTSIFQVTVWVFGGILLTYSKVSIATIFRPLGSRALMWIGVMQQVGSFLGAVLFYLIINVWSLFESAPFCPVWSLAITEQTFQTKCKSYPNYTNKPGFCSLSLINRQAVLKNV